MGVKGKAALGLLIVLLIYGFFRAEEVPPEPEGPCDTDEFGCVEIERDEPILLATMLDRSGRRSSVGNDSFHGVLLAADYIDGSFDGENARFLGREVAFVHKNERCSPRGGKYGARELVSDPLANGLLAVIGGTCDSGTLGVADQILSNEGVTMISPSITHPSLTGPNRAEFFFRTAHNGELESVALAEFAAEELQVRSAVFLSVPHSEAVHPFARSLLRRDRRVVRLDMDRESPDVQQTTEQLSVGVDGHPPDVIYLPGGPRYQSPAIQAAQQGSLRAVPLLTEQHRLPDRSVLDQMQPKQELYVAGPNLDFSGTFYDEEFLPAYRARFGEPTARYHAHAFDATMLVLKTLEEVAIVDTSDEGDQVLVPRTALRDALAAAKNFEGISGVLTCDGNGDCNPDAPILVRKFEDGRSTVVWRSTDS